VSEGEIQDAVRLALADVPGLVLWRNNVGMAEHWSPKGVRRTRYGLAPGSADLIGCLSGRFVALEIKTPTGRLTPEQKTWLALVERHGGLTAVVHSADEALAVVRGWL